jgi:hypothetical protein
MASAATHAGTSAPYRSRRSERTPRYQVVQEWRTTCLELARQADWDGDAVPPYVEREFCRFLECGILTCDFARAYCDACGHDCLVACSCTGRGVCPSAWCGAWRRPRRIGSITSYRRCRCASGVRSDRLSRGQSQRSERPDRMCGLGARTRDGFTPHNSIGSTNPWSAIQCSAAPHGASCWA